MTFCFTLVRGTIFILLLSTMASALIVNRRVLACELLAMCRLFARVCVCVCVLEFSALCGQSVKHNKQSVRPCRHWQPVAVFMCTCARVLVYVHSKLPYLHVSLLIKRCSQNQSRTGTNHFPSFSENRPILSFFLFLVFLSPSLAVECHKQPLWKWSILLKMCLLQK